MSDRVLLAPLLLAPLLLAQPAGAAEEVRDWERLQDSLLLEAAYGDTSRAVQDYEDIARRAKDLPPGHLLRTESLYWLGHARYTLGDTAAARRALLEGVQGGCPRHLCLDLLGRIELAESSVRTVPVRWSFDDASHGVIHPWRYHEGGSSFRLRSDTPDGNRVLAWTTVVDRSSENQLVIGFDHPDPAPRVLRFRLSATGFPGWIKLVAIDLDGQRFSLSSDQSALLAPPDAWRSYEIQLDQMLGLDRARANLEPQRLHKILVQDVTAYNVDGRSGQQHEIWIDDFEVVD